MSKALFGAGCFWGVEEYFQNIDGIINTKVGYSGGNTKNPTYEIVCSGNTNHAEVLEVEYNENKISYNEILEHFFKCHNPTTPNRQGLDIGTQYRSIIFYFNDLQKTIAEEIKNKNQKKFNNQIVTEIKKAEKFYLAEDYHQNYINKLKNN